MNTVTALAIDDEAAARARLKRLLKQEPRVTLLGEASDGPAAVEAIHALQPQLLFLDVQMPAMDGFDVLRMLEGEAMPAVIFVTAFDQYAIKAFEVAAVDYLLKPFDQARLSAAIDKAMAAVSTDWGERIEGILSRIDTESFPAQIPVHHNKRIRLLETAHISHITSEHRLINVYDIEGQRYWTNETLDQLERRLDPARFFRIHRGSLINLLAPFEIEPHEDGRLRVCYSNGAVLAVARGPAKTLKQRMGL